MTYSKVSKTMSFFPLRDSSGTAQLVAFRPKAMLEEASSPDTQGPPPSAIDTLSDSPVESAVVIEGEVRLRPPKQQRPVSIAHPASRKGQPRP
jgi:aspartyl-tRNA synthetase